MQSETGRADVPSSAEARCAFQTISNLQEVLDKAWRYNGQGDDHNGQGDDHNGQGDDHCFDQVNLLLSYL